MESVEKPQVNHSPIKGLKLRSTFDGKKKSSRPRIDEEYYEFE